MRKNKLKVLCILLSLLTVSCVYYDFSAVENNIDIILQSDNSSINIFDDNQHSIDLIFLSDGITWIPTHYSKV